MRSTIANSTNSMPKMSAAAKRFAVGPGLVAHLSYSPLVGGLGCFVETQPSRQVRNTKLKSTERNALNSLIGTFSVERPEMFDFAHPLRM